MQLAEQVLWQTNKPNRTSNMLSWLARHTFVPVAIKTTGVIGTEAQAFFTDLRPLLHGNIFTCIRNFLAAFAPSVYTKMAKTIGKMDVFEDSFKSGSFKNTAIS